MDVLTWTVERRMYLAERAELLRKELVGIEAEVARLEAAEVVFGQWAEATDGGHRPSSIIQPEPMVVVAGPGVMRLVPDRVEGVGGGGPLSPWSRAPVPTPDGHPGRSRR
ncbi:hypothetical protein [Streptomyces adustus]|uniref:hypothetical protein n=1 Tax=Streptomyces adustus TaxID=1609272 RepID=UPI003715E5A3